MDESILKRRAYQRLYYKKNREHILALGKEYRLRHPDRVRQCRKRWKLRNPEKLIGYRARDYQKHKTERDALHTAWCEKNKEKLLAYRKTQQEKFNKYERDRIKRDPVFRINKIMSAGLRSFLSGKKNKTRWSLLVGYTAKELKNHLEKLFEPGMTWLNHGRDGWHIDHIRPKSWFKYDAPGDKTFKQCWALENLQPKWASENRSKGNRYEG